VINVDPSATQEIESLSKLGLKGEIVAYYQEFQRKLPSSEIPSRMLKTLESD